MKLAVTVTEFSESPGETCWRLVHDGVKVIDLFESEGLTWTAHTLFCATTRAECEAEIARLGLTPLAEGSGG